MKGSTLTSAIDRLFEAKDAPAQDMFGGKDTGMFRAYEAFKSGPALAAFAPAPAPGHNFG